MVFFDAKKIKREYRLRRSLWGEKPNRFVSLIPGMISNGNVLDIGAGQGRNALYLARKGFKVTGVDISKAAIAELSARAKEENLRIKGVVADIVGYRIGGKYEAVICVAALHFVPKGKAAGILAHIKKHTAENGVNLLTAFTKKDIGYKEHPTLSFFDKEELAAFYRDWKIILCKDYTKKETHGAAHEHRLCVLIAQKRS